MTDSRRLARLTLATDPRLLRPACAFVRHTALGAGLDERLAGDLEHVVEEAGILVIEQSFGGRKDGEFDILVQDEGARFVVAFEDRGLPFDWSRAETAESTGLSVQLLRGLADELRFVNLGKQGKRLEFVLSRSDGMLESPFMDGTSQPRGEEPAAAPMDTPLELRPLDPGRDGVALARCMYNVYGYTYNEVVYFPERMRDLIAKGLLVSLVAVAPDGEIAGHQGLKKATADARVANVSMGVVDPRFRGRKLFERLKEEAFGRVKAAGLLGLYGEAVTLHPYSQKANFASGGRETGILLAYIPGGRSFNKIDGAAAAAADRQTAVLFYIRLNAEPRRAVYLPEKHRAMIERIYAWTGLDRAFAQATPQDWEALPERSEVDLRVVNGYDQGILTVIKAGRDLPDLLRVRLNELKLARMDVIYVDLPLSDPATQLLAPRLEELGFSFCGIYPEMAESGDLLRLHCLNNVPVDPSKIVMVTDFGRELLAYVLEQVGM